MALRESEERYRLLVELSPEPIAVHIKGQLVYVNPAGASLIGATRPEELIGRSIMEFVHPDYRAIVLERARRTQEENLLVDTIEEKFIRLDGHIIDVEVVAIPTLYTGQPATQVVIRDTTIRKRAEYVRQFLTETTTLLTHSLDYETTLANLARLVLPTLGDWCFVDVIENQNVIRRVATAAVDPSKETLLREVQLRFPPTWDSPQPAAQSLRLGTPVLLLALNPTSIRAASVNSEHFQLMQALDPRSAMAVPLIARGQTLGVITFAMSESGRSYSDEDVALAQELAQRAAIAIDNSRLYREAQQAIQARDEFLSIAAHELKTPITSLRGFAQLNLRIFRKAITPDLTRLEQGLQVIDEQAEKLSRLIMQLLDISRVEAGKLKLDQQMTDISQLIRHIVMRAQASTDKHQLVVQAPPTVSALVDGLRIEQVISNLIDNAIKYSPNGGPITITLSTPDDQRLQIVIMDQGLGVPPSQRPYIFDRFYRAHADKQFGGLGLGLYISRQIVELHGGSIRAEFPDEGGTHFIVELPGNQVHTF
jgi:PAS domain S-box-containing protein